MAEHARAVIIGGVVGGRSIACHLAKRGWADVVLVDLYRRLAGAEIDVFGEWIGCEVVGEPLWDPNGSRIRA